MLDLERKHSFCESRVLICLGEMGGNVRPLQVMALAAQKDLWARGSRDTPILSWALGWLSLESWDVGYPSLSGVILEAAGASSESHTSSLAGNENSAPEGD